MLPATEYTTSIPNMSWKEKPDLGGHSYRKTQYNFSFEQNELNWHF